MAEKKGGQDPRHPKSTYEARYPYNRVEVTESGHERHYDDTPGKERIREAHKSGTYYEISPDGKKVEQVVGNSVRYVKGGETKTVDKDSDTKVHGSSRTNISGDSHSETKGSTTTTSGGHSKQIVGGNQVSAVNGDSVSGVRGSLSQSIGGGANTKVDGNWDWKTDGTHNTEVGKEMTISGQSTGTYSYVGNLLLTSQSEIKLMVGQSSITITTGSIIIDSPEVVLTKEVFVGMDSPGERVRIKIITEGGPAKQAFSKVG
jgi:hypothetical protein